MINLTAEEREKFAAYLEQESVNDWSLAEQAEKIGALPVSRKLRFEAVAAKIVAESLRSSPVKFTIGDGDD